MLETNSNSVARMAVFVDIENVAGYCDYLGVPVDIAPVLARLTSLARPILRRSFGDVAALPNRFQIYQVRRMLQLNQIMHEDIPHRPSNHSKNSADIRLVVEAVALAHQRPDFTHFAVFSNDRDFIPLFNHLRELGKIVIGCGPSQSMVNEDYRNACDLFLFHDEIVPPPIVFPAPGVAPTGAPIASAVALDTATSMTLVTPVTSVNDTAVALVPQGAAPQTDVERLLAVVHSVRRDGQPSFASVVATRMKIMFPEFDVKMIFGTFKWFCIEQSKTGKVRLLNTDQANFLILPEEEFANTASDATCVAPQEGVSADVMSLSERYRHWALRKMKIAIPPPSERQQLYDAMLVELAVSQEGSPISLKELADVVGAARQNMQNVAFRVFYGLFRSRALRCMTTEDPFNPGVLGLDVPPEQLDQHFVENTLNVFRRDASGLPFDEAAWAMLMYAEPPAEPAFTPTEIETPTPEPELMPTPMPELEAQLPLLPEPAQPPISEEGDAAPKAPTEDEFDPVASMLSNS